MGEFRVRLLLGFLFLLFASARAGEIKLEVNTNGNQQNYSAILQALSCVTIQRGSANGDVKDTSIFPTPQKSTAGVSNGGLPYLFVSGPGTPAYQANATALLQFSFKNLPAGAILHSADLALTTMNVASVNVHKVTKSWSESTTTPLGSGVSSTVYRTVPFSASNPVMHIDLTELVLKWLSGADANHGIELALNPGPSLGGPPQVGTLMIESSEGAHPPQLTLCFMFSTCAGKADGTACDQAASCVSGGKCKGGVCQGGEPAAAGTVCRPASDLCDVAEVCDGENQTCPAADIEKAGTVCRASTGPCDPADLCSGAAIQCPSVFLTTVCDAASGSCEESSYCDGKSGACPKKKFKSSNTVCRDAASKCDVEEKCTGSSASCPKDGFKPVRTVCGSAPKNSPCATAPTCSGTSSKCPKSDFAPLGTVCGPNLQLGQLGCVVQATCSGKSVDCPSNRPAKDGSDCDGGGGICRNGGCTGCGTGMASCCVGARGPCPGATGLICQGGTCVADQSHSPGCGSQDNLCCGNQTCNLPTLFCQNPGSTLSRCMPCGKLHDPCCHQYDKPPYGCDSNYGCKHTSALYTCEKP